jgi:hypothetical protein
MRKNKSIAIVILCLIQLAAHTLLAEETFTLKLAMEKYDGFDSVSFELSVNNNEVAKPTLESSDDPKKFDITAYLKDGTNTIRIVLKKIAGNDDFVELLKKRTKDGNQSIILNCTVMRNGESMKEHVVSATYDGTITTVHKDLSLTIKRQKE